MVDQGYATRSDYVLQMLNELPYAVWRDYDPEDTIRFYGLRMRARHDQVAPSEAHRRAYGLALS
jgi:hypothetical protein